MKGTKLNIFYILFFLVAAATISIIVFEKPIRTITRATSSIVSGQRSVLIANALQAVPKKDAIAITIFVRNAQGDAIANKSVQVLSDGGVLSPPSAVSDQDGKANFTLQSELPGKIIVRAKIDGVDVENTVTVYFK